MRWKQHVSFDNKSVLWTETPHIQSTIWDLFFAKSDEIYKVGYYYNIFSGYNMQIYWSIKLFMISAAVLQVCTISSMYDITYQGKN